MKSFLRVAMLGIALIAGCSSYEINYDYDVDSNFSEFKTYAWMPRTISDATGAAKGAIQTNTLLDGRIRSAVDAQMGAKGFTMAASDTESDLLAVYHIGLKDKIDVTDWGYTYAGSYWGGGLGRSVDVYQYTEGTLVVDLVNRSTMKLVWRGSATGVVEQSSPEEQARRVNDVVARIFEKYPPKG